MDAKLQNSLLDLTIYIFLYSCNDNEWTCKKYSMSDVIL